MPKAHQEVGQEWAKLWHPVSPQSQKHPSLRNVHAKILNPMQIEVIKGSILEVDADVIVNPANSLGLMGGGVAGVIKRFGGEEIEKEAVQKAPIPVGSAVLTTAGKLKFKGVIHAPTMEKPAMESSEEKVRKAVRQAWSWRTVWALRP